MLSESPSARYRTAEKSSQTRHHASSCRDLSGKHRPASEFHWEENYGIRNVIGLLPQLRTGIGQLADDECDYNAR